MPEFEWDEAKRQSNIEKHRIDFLRAWQLWDGRPVLELTSRYEAEQRFERIGVLEGQMVCAVWTYRENRLRLISVRRAHDDEERKYRAIYGG